MGASHQILRYVGPLTSPIQPVIGQIITVSQCPVISLLVFIAVKQLPNKIGACWRKLVGAIHELPLPIEAPLPSVIPADFVGTPICYPVPQIDRSLAAAQRAI